MLIFTWVRQSVEWDKQKRPACNAMQPPERWWSSNSLATPKHTKKQYTRRLIIGVKSISLHSESQLFIQSARFSHINPPKPSIAHITWKLTLSRDKFTLGDGWLVGWFAWLVGSLPLTLRIIIRIEGRFFAISAQIKFISHHSGARTHHQLLLVPIQLSLNKVISSAARIILFVCTTHRN